MAVSSIGAVGVDMSRGRGRNIMGVSRGIVAVVSRGRDRAMTPGSVGRNRGRFVTQVRVHRSRGIILCGVRPE